MNKLITLAAVAAAGVASLAWQPALAADIGVSVQISQPGVYGRVDIGRFPGPTVIVQQPVIVHRAPPPPRYVHVQPVQPVYMWVPPGHQKKWSRHCSQYGACGVPVVFVQDRWYRDHVMVNRHGGDDRWARGGYDGPRGGYRSGDRRDDDRWDDRRGRGDRHDHGGRGHGRDD
jgi:hypothetical protein